MPAIVLTILSNGIQKFHNENFLRKIQQWKFNNENSTMKIQQWKFDNENLTMKLATMKFSQWKFQQWKFDNETATMKIPTMKNQQWNVNNEKANNENGRSHFNMEDVNTFVWFYRGATLECSRNSGITSMLHTLLSICTYSFCQVCYFSSIVFFRSSKQLARGGSLIVLHGTSSATWGG